MVVNKPVDNKICLKLSGFSVSCKCWCFDSPWPGETGCLCSVMWEQEDLWGYRRDWVWAAPLFLEPQHEQPIGILQTGTTFIPEKGKNCNKNLYFSSARTWKKNAKRVRQKYKTLRLIPRLPNLTKSRICVFVLNTSSQPNIITEPVLRLGIILSSVSKSWIILHV